MNNPNTRTAVFRIRLNRKIKDYNVLRSRLDALGAEWDGALKLTGTPVIYVTAPANLEVELRSVPDVDTVALFGFKDEN